MKRSVLLLFVLGILVGDTGCRMCGSPYDYCVPAYTQRENDYRGCDPVYRSGSIFNRHADYNGTDFADCVDCNLGNAGNFGETRAIDRKSPKPVTPSSKTPGAPHIAVPSAVPESNGRSTPARPTTAPESDFDMPSIDELIRNNPTTLQPNSTQADSILSEPFSIQSPDPGPPQPPVSPKEHPIPVPTLPNSNPFPPSPAPESPFPTQPSPFSEPIPTSPFDSQIDPGVTLEELRRHDPTITDVKILNIEEVIQTGNRNNAGPQ